MSKWNFRSFSRIALGVGLSTFVCALSIQAAENSPAETPKVLMERTVHELLAVVKANPGDENRPYRHIEMRKIIEPRFDFQEMSRRSLGPYWNKIDAAQRTEFVSLFSELLARTYLNRIDNIDNSEVNVTGERVKAPKALVRTEVTFQGDEFPIDYRLVEKEAHWRVYDVIIENIGLVANYRNEFAGIIRREKFSGLIDRLRSKIENGE